MILTSLSGMYWLKKKSSEEDFSDTLKATQINFWNPSGTEY